MREEHRLLSALDVERHVVEQHRAIGIDGFQAFHLKNLVARLAFHGEDDAGILTARRANLLHVELLEHLLARCGLLRLGHIGREAAYELLQLLAAFFSFQALVLSLTQGELRRLVPERIVSGEDRHLAEVDVYRLCRDSIEEVAVVTHHEHTLLQVAQILLQPLHGVEVEVVGRLVEQQIVGMTKESLGQHNAHLLVVRQLRHHHIVAVVLHTEVLEQLSSLAFSLPAVHLGKLQFKVGSQIAVFLAHLRLGIESLALLHVLPKRLVSLQHRVHHGEAVVLEVILVEHREALSGSQLYRSFVGFELAADGFQQR